MKVKELQRLLKAADPEGEVFACEYGHRSSALLDTERAEFMVDPRACDDWGNPKREPGDPNPANLYIALGNCGDNRYPPAGLFGEEGDDEDGEF
jgi:hypothetical protein